MIEYKSVIKNKLNNKNIILIRTIDFPDDNEFKRMKVFSYTLENGKIKYPKNAYVDSKKIKNKYFKYTIYKG